MVSLETRSETIPFIAGHLEQSSAVETSDRRIERRLVEEPLRNRTVCGACHVLRQQFSQASQHRSYLVPVRVRKLKCGIEATAGRYAPAERPPIWSHGSTAAG